VLWPERSTGQALSYRGVRSRLLRAANAAGRLLTDKKRPSDCLDHPGLIQMKTSLVEVLIVLNSVPTRVSRRLATFLTPIKRDRTGFPLRSIGGTPQNDM
jgi:hypothetical protein